MSERVQMLLSIVQQEHGHMLISKLRKMGVPVHYQCIGHGTAPSEILDILGLGTSDKDIVISFATESKAQELLGSLHSAFLQIGRIHGLILLLKTTAISKLLSMMVQPAAAIETTGGSNMNYNSDNSLICISVNLGFTDQVMHVARQAGARGGTVIKARLAGGTTPEETLGVELNQEKELVLILAPKKDAAGIMTAVNKEFGLRSKAQALIHAMPVEHAMKI